ncbi:hypothetical protein GQ543_11760 [candidate division WOR-3 bacterium]|nr:hypothetical protein [candidate division WOR-3 bacterium]
MKKYVSLIVLFSLIGMLWAQEKGSEGETEEKDYEDGMYEGKIAGEQVSQSSWMMYGCLGGTLFGCLGGGGVWLLSNSGELPPYVPKGNTGYKQGYVLGYKEATKSKKSSKALIGGIVGTLIGGVIVYLIVSAED